MIGFSQNEQGENFRFVLARLNPSGTLDLSFGRGGKVITDPTADRDIAMSAALQKDGKIIVLGTRGDDQCLACAGHALVRYLSDGRLDPTFGQSGKVLDSFSSGSFSFQVNARDVVVQPDSKLVVLGSNELGIALARYSPNGVRDLSFGKNGLVATLDGATSPDGGAKGAAIAVGLDGKLVIVGEHLNRDDSQNTLLIRYNPNGSLDSSFGNGGKVRRRNGPTGGVGADDVIVQRNGRIVSGGSSFRRTPAGFFSDFALLRYYSDGRPDLTFGGGDGATSTHVDVFAGAIALAVAPDGRLVLAGFSQNFNPQRGGDPNPAYRRDFALARYTSSGALDTRFSGDGKATTRCPYGGAFSVADGVVVQPDGKIVAAGGAQGADGGDLAVARYRYE